MNQSVATATEEQTAVVDSLNMDITEINTLNQEGVENLQATLRACSNRGRSTTTSVTRTTACRRKSRRTSAPSTSSAASPAAPKACRSASRPTLPLRSIKRPRNASRSPAGIGDTRWVLPG